MYRPTPLFAGAIAALLLVFLLVFLQAATAAPALTPQAEEACGNEGGCVYVSKKWINDRLGAAYKKGVEQAEVNCGNRTSWN
jgi:hypothetical protein